MLTYFRIISIIEGISFLAILSVTVNIISRDYIFAIGMTHGVLFFRFYKTSDWNNLKLRLLIYAFLNFDSI